MMLYNGEGLASRLPNSNAYIVYLRKYNCNNQKNMATKQKKKKDDDARKGIEEEPDHDQ
jgi:hypothetical protein